MSRMSDFEIRANNIHIAIETAGHRVDDFGYSDDSTHESVSRVIGMFITWLTACEEARLQGSFFSKVINQLPANDDPSWDTYIMPQPSTSLKQRVEALWGIRIAFTHGDGDINLITNQNNKNFALNAPNILDGVSIENNVMILNENIYPVAIKTMVQIRDVLA